ncbi:MAG: hypothetical protein HDQ93_05000 [Desulfovibrio sp.]|nr:hypothetical protein [Desulfovibrio sp.]
MSVKITCEGVDQGIARMNAALDAIGGKRAGKVIANALNQSLAAGRKEAAREARKAYTAPIRKLFDSIKIQRARGSNLHGELDLTGSKGVSMIHFKAQPNVPAVRPTSGVTAQTKKQGSRKARFSKNGGSKSFIMKKKQGGFGVFVRHGRKKFEMLMGPSPIQALQRQDSQEHVSAKVEEAFAPRLQAEIDRVLASLRGSSR